MANWTKTTALISFHIGLMKEILIHMSNEKLYEILLEIHDYCASHKCEECVFEGGYGTCQIQDFGDEINLAPQYWDMPVIKITIEQ